MSEETNGKTGRYVLSFKEKLAVVNHLQGKLVEWLHGNKSTFAEAARRCVADLGFPISDAQLIGICEDAGIAWPKRDKVLNLKSESRFNSLSEQVAELKKRVAELEDYITRMGTPVVSVPSDNRISGFEDTLLELMQKLDQVYKMVHTSQNEIVTHRGSLNKLLNRFGLKPLPDGVTDPRTITVANTK